MSSNLYQAINYDDLLYLMKQQEKKSVVLTMVLLNTNDKMKTMLRKYIKKKSSEYPDTLFIYYVARDNDFTKSPQSLFDDKSRFPKVLHIFNFTELLAEVAQIDNTECIDQSFDELKGFYDEYRNKNRYQHQPEEIIEKMNPETERKRLEEKLNILYEKTKTYEMEFLEDCMNRKKEEEKEEKKKKKLAK